MCLIVLKQYYNAKHLNISQNRRNCLYAKYYLFCSDFCSYMLSSYNPSLCPKKHIQNWRMIEMYEVYPRFTKQIKRLSLFTVIQRPCLEEGISLSSFDHKEEDVSSSYIARQQQNAYIRHPFHGFSCSKECGGEKLLLSLCLLKETGIYRSKESGKTVVFN